MIVEMIRMIEIVNWAITSSFHKGELLDPVEAADFIIFTGEKEDK